MRKALALILVLAASSAEAAAPRLLVLISVDQMQADFLMKGVPNGGLARLRGEGFVFTNARHLHVPTETGPGHAALSTGRYPYGHGIVGNYALDRRSGAMIYCVADSVHKFGPERLTAYTFGDALKAADPLSKVVSVSVKDRAAILMGGKKADMAIWFDKKAGTFTTSSYYGAAPDWLPAFNAPRKSDADVVKTPRADRLTLELALEAARRYGLGADGHPDVLAIGFSATDYVGHAYGSRSKEMDVQLLALDGVLGELLDGLTALAGKDGLVVVLSADHGGRPVSAPTSMTWDDLAAAMEKALQAEQPAAAPWILSDDVVPNLYLNRDLARALRLDWADFLRRAAKRLETVKGVAKAYVPDEMPAGDPYAQVYALSYMPGRSGDLLIRTADEVTLHDPEEVGTHGSPYEYDARVPLVFWGAGVARGSSDALARLTDLAPTAAALLGVGFSPEPGARVLPVAAPGASK